MFFATSVLRATCMALLTLTVLCSTAMAGVNIPTFSDATSTRLSASNAVGAGDTSEKDFAFADLDNDGDIDVLVGRRIGLNNNNGTAVRNTLLLNEGGVLTDMTSISAPAMLAPRRTRDIIIADFDGNGLLDAIQIDGPNNAPLLLMNAGFSGKEWSGLVSTPDRLPAGFSVDGWTASAGDLVNDGDAYLDIFIGVRIGNDRLLVNMGVIGGTWQGFSDGSSRLGTNANTSAVRSSAIADLNGDGDMDIVEGVTNPTAVARLLHNDGSGQFTASPQTLVSGAAYNFALGDLDGNGDLDIFGVRNGVDQYRLNNGPGAGESILLGSPFFAPGSNGFGAICRVADLNTDGTDDFLVTDLDQEFPQDCSRRLKIYLNSGVSPYLINAYPAVQPWTPSGTSDVAMFDIDEDGDLDMLIGHCSGNSVFLQDGSPSIQGDVDGDSDVDLLDVAGFFTCENGPGNAPDVTPPLTVEACLDAFDIDGDGDVDYANFGDLQRVYTGP